MAPVHINIYNRSRSPRSRSRRRRRRRSSSTPRRSRRGNTDRRVQLRLEDLPNRPPIDWVGPYQLPVRQEAPPRDWRGPSVVSQRPVSANTVLPYATAMPMPSIMPSTVAAPDVNQFFATQTMVRSFATTIANPYGAAPLLLGNKKILIMSLSKLPIGKTQIRLHLLVHLRHMLPIIRCGILSHFLRLTLLLDEAIGLGLCWKQLKD